MVGMQLPVMPPVSPMLAKGVRDIPDRDRVLGFRQQHEEIDGSLDRAGALAGRGFGRQRAGPARNAHRASLSPGG